MTTTADEEQEERLNHDEHSDSDNHSDSESEAEGSEDADIPEHQNAGQIKVKVMPKQRQKRTVKNVDLYDPFMTAGVASEETVSAWMDIKDCNAALLQLFNFIIQLSGFNTVKLSMDQLQEAIDNANDEDDSITELIQQLQTSVLEESSESADYPLISKKKQFKKFQSNLTDFWSRWTRHAQFKYMRTDDRNIFHHIKSFLTICASSAIRPLRHTCTMIVLTIITSLVQRSSTLETPAVNDKAKGLLHTIQSHITDLMDGVFVHRNKDIDPVIRAECIKSLGQWMMSYPSHFLHSPQSSDRYLRLIGWTLSDQSILVRQSVVKELANVLTVVTVDNLAFMQFIERFKGRLLEMSLYDHPDISQIVAESVVPWLSSHNCIELEECQQLFTVFSGASTDSVKESLANVVLKSFIRDSLKPALDTCFTQSATGHYIFKGHGLMEQDNLTVIRSLIQLTQNIYNTCLTATLQREVQLKRHVDGQEFRKPNGESIQELIQQLGAEVDSAQYRSAFMDSHIVTLKYIISAATSTDSDDEELAKTWFLLSHVLKDTDRLLELLASEASPFTGAEDCSLVMLVAAACRSAYNVSYGDSVDFISAYTNKTTSLSKPQTKLGFKKNAKKFSRDFRRSPQDLVATLIKVAPKFALKYGGVMANSFFNDVSLHHSVIDQCAREAATEMYMFWTLVGVPNTQSDETLNFCSASSVWIEKQAELQYEEYFRNVFEHDLSKELDSRLSSVKAVVLFSNYNCGSLSYSLTGKDNALADLSLPIIQEYHQNFNEWIAQALIDKEKLDVSVARVKAMRFLNLVQYSQSLKLSSEIFGQLSDLAKEMLGRSSLGAFTGKNKPTRYTLTLIESLCVDVIRDCFFTASLALKSLKVRNDEGWKVGLSVVLNLAKLLLGIANRYATFIASKNEQHVDLSQLFSQNPFLAGQVLNLKGNSGMLEILAGLVPLVVEVNSPQVDAVFAKSVNHGITAFETMMKYGFAALMANIDVTGVARVELDADTGKGLAQMKAADLNLLGFAGNYFANTASLGRTYLTNQQRNIIWPRLKSILAAAVRLAFSVYQLPSVDDLMEDALSSMVFLIMMYGRWNSWVDGLLSRLIDNWVKMMPSVGLDEDDEMRVGPVEQVVADMILNARHCALGRYGSHQPHIQFAHALASSLAKMSIADHENAATIADKIVGNVLSDTLFEMINAVFRDYRAEWSNDLTWFVVESLRFCATLLAPVSNPQTVKITGRKNVEKLHLFKDYSGNCQDFLDQVQHILQKSNVPFDQVSLMKNCASKIADGIAKFPGVNQKRMREWKNEAIAKRTISAMDLDASDVENIDQEENRPGTPGSKRSISVESAEFEDSPIVKRAR